MTSLILMLPFLFTPDLGQTSAIDAVAVLEKAIQAHGGLAALQGIQDITREFEGTALGGVGQGIRPDSAASYPTSMISIRDVRRQRILETRAITPTGAPEQRVTTVITADSAFQALAGQNVVAKFPPQALPSMRARFQRRLPEALLLNAAAHPEALRFLGDDTFEDKAQRVVAYADTDGTALSLFFDAATGLLTKASVVTDDPVLGDTTTDLVFRDYSEEHGVKLPHRQQELLGGQVAQDMRITSLRINSSPADSLFSLPENYKALALPTPKQGTVKMADNIYTVQGSYNSMFAVFPDYVVVLEGPLSNDFSDLVLREVHKAAPGKPVKYVVVTHFHFDHISGIRRWVSEGVTIVCTPAARQAIERAVAAPHRLRPDALSRNPKAPVFEIVKGETRVFEGGGVRLEARDISPIPHVAEMLVGYFPGARVLYEADMISARDGKMFVTADTRELARKIDGWQVDRIVNVHGDMSTLDALKEGIAESK